jgi:hypothetical protein
MYFMLLYSLIVIRDSKSAKRCVLGVECPACGRLDMLKIGTKYFVSNTELLRAIISANQEDSLSHILYISGKIWGKVVETFE